MSVREEWFIRGYRPGRCSVPEEEEDDQAQVVRLANVEVYAKRASAGLPLFREIRESTSVLSRDKAGPVVT